MDRGQDKVIDWQPFTNRGHSAGTQRWRETRACSLVFILYFLMLMSFSSFWCSGLVLYCFVICVFSCSLGIDDFRFISSLYCSHFVPSVSSLCWSFCFYQVSCGSSCFILLSVALCVCVPCSFHFLYYLLYILSQSPLFLCRVLLLSWCS